MCVLSRQSYICVGDKFISAVGVLYSIAEIQDSSFLLENFYMSDFKEKKAEIIKYQLLGLVYGYFIRH